MRRAYIPPMKSVPPGADDKTRQAMFEDYQKQLVELNPEYFDSHGQLLKWYEVSLVRWSIIFILVISSGGFLLAMTTGGL